MIARSRASDTAMLYIQAASAMSSMPVSIVAAIEGERRISVDGARLQAFVIPTHEEMEIARGTLEALHEAKAARGPLKE